MRIVIIGPAWPFRGGIAHFSALLAQTLAARGHSVKIITFTRMYPGILFPGKTQFDESSATPAIESEALLDSIWPPSWRRTAAAAIAFAPDLVIFKHWMPFFAPAYAGIAKAIRRRCRARLLFLCHNIIPHEGHPGDRWLTRRGLRHADHYIVLSDAVEQQLLTLFPRASYARVAHPLYAFFPRSWSREEARRELGLAEERVVLFFGYIRRYKGVSVLLEAMAAAQPRMAMKLIIAGEIYGEKTVYTEQINRLGIGDVVQLLDTYIPNERVGLYYAAADVVALPYLSATQSGIVQVCYHFDKPVIASDVGGLPEVVEDGRSGYIVPAGDAPALADALVRFFAENHAAEFTARIAEIKQLYSWDRMAEAIEQLTAGGPDDAE